MRSFSLFVALGSSAALAACASVPQQTATTVPTVSYTYSTDDDPDDIADTADTYCDDNYGKSAVLTDRSVDGDRFEVTYACQ